MMYVIEVLRGSKNQRVLEMKHDRLSTWGIGADTPALQWENILRQLIHLGYLVQDFTRFGALGLSSAARPVLKGELPVILGLPRDAVETVEKGKKRAGGRKDYDQALFDALRATRKKLADAAGVPPFVVFSDATLAEMARFRPTDSHTLLQVSGVGEHKLRQYGKAFLEVIFAYCQEKSENTVSSLSDKDLALTISDTQKETLRLYREGLDLSGISASRGLKDSTVAAHLEELLNLGADVELLRFVDVEKIPLIQARLAAVGPGSLAELREGLPETISYEDIRFVRGAWNCGQRV
jgi:ATP-dependent DNA helicase RecQ